MCSCGRVCRTSLNLCCTTRASLLTWLTYSPCCCAVISCSCKGCVQPGPAVSRGHLAAVRLHDQRARRDRGSPAQAQHPDAATEGSAVGDPPRAGREGTTRRRGHRHVAIESAHRLGKRRCRCSRCARSSGALASGCASLHQHVVSSLCFSARSTVKTRIHAACALLCCRVALAFCH